MPLLEQAVEDVEGSEVGQLQKEKIEDQKCIISLQQKLLDVNENGMIQMKKSVQDIVKEEFKTAQDTIQTEIKSYSSAVKSSCSEALSQKKIRAALKSATEKEDRSKNVIIYGVQETATEALSERVSGILQEIGEKPAVTDCCRVGVKKDSAGIRPVKFTVRSSDVANHLFRRAKLLRSIEGYNSVYICPDRTLSERRAYKKLLDELKLKRGTEPNMFHVIRNNKIISNAKSVSEAPDTT